MTFSALDLPLTVRSVNPDDPHSHLPEPTLAAQGVLQGFTLPPERRTWLHEQIGRELPESVYVDTPTGARILVAPDSVSNRFGALYLPESVVDRARMEMGAGWVVSVGPLVGSAGNGAPHPGPVLCSHPTDLLGAHVIYRQYAGVNIKLSKTDNEFGGESALVLLTDRDILLVRSGE